MPAASCCDTGKNMCAICALWQPVLASEARRREKAEVNEKLGRGNMEWAGAPMNSMHASQPAHQAPTWTWASTDGQARIWRGSYLTMTALPEHVEGLDALARVPESCVGELAGVCACVV